MVLHVSVQFEELGSRTSTFDRLIWIIAWCQRFVAGARGKLTSLTSSHLSLAELRQAEQTLVRHSQEMAYPEAFQLLRSEKFLPRGHPLAPLAPYIDEEGMLRVGGRLQKAELPTQGIHPILLPPRSHIVLLLVRRTHLLLLHAGPSTVASTLAATYHIPRINQLLRNISKSCVPCQRAYARTSRQCMGELPAIRTHPTRPFEIVGIDFAGPIYIRKGLARHPAMVKSYLCIFICFTTRALHVEVVSDMTTAAFLAALTRFTARRGLPSRICTDNGSNFIGAEAELKRTLETLCTEASHQSVSYWASQRHILWSFSPARAPHFGGLWEAAVKSVKTILRKVLGGHRLTFEELCTVSTEAEAVVNSRPLTPMNTFSDDAIAPLTPGHFLVGGPLLALPSLPDFDSNISNVRRWNLVVRLTHEIWRRWKHEYLQHLQKRNKWLKPQHSLQVDDVVLVKDHDSFLRDWPMGRVVKTYPGKDELVRVVDVKSQGKIIRRPITGIVRLLNEDDAPLSGGVCSRNITMSPTEADES